jgi:hypothetical protein
LFELLLENSIPMEKILTLREFCKRLIGYVVKESRKSAPDRIAAAHVVDPV